MAKLGLSEILKRTSEQPAEEQGEFLRRNWNPTLGLMIRYAFDAGYEWAIPEGTPPYTENKYLDQESNLYAESRKMYIFMRGTGDHVPQKKKELNFIQLLENLTKEDAELLLMIKDGKLPYGITQEFIIAELPGQITTPREPSLQEETPAPATFPEATTDAVVETPAEDVVIALDDPVVDTPPIVAKPKTVRKKRVTKKKTVARKAKTSDK